MTAPQTDATTDHKHHRSVAAERRRGTGTEAALAEELAARTAELASATANTASGSSISPRPSTC